jgi:hypothetical protein
MQHTYISSIRCPGHQCATVSVAMAHISPVAKRLSHNIREPPIQRPRLTPCEPDHLQPPRPDRAYCHACKQLPLLLDSCISRVLPCFVLPLGSAPDSRRSCATWSFSPSRAILNAVAPGRKPRSHVISSCAPLATSSRTIPSECFSTATIRGVWPSPSRSSTETT